MARIDANAYLGERPGLHPQKLQPHEAQVARNVRLLSRSLEPFYGRANAQATTTGTPPRTVFQDRSGNWLEFTGRTHVVNSVIGDDPYDRVYFTNSNGPRVSDNARRISGPGPYPGASLKLGVPSLDQAPGATIVDIGDEEDADGAPNLKQSRIYVVTLTNAYGEEGVQSPSSAQVEVYPGATVELSLPSAPGGDYDLDQYFVYRITEGVAQYVGKTGIASTTFTDNLAGDLGQEALQSDTYYPPPDGLRGLIAVNGRFLAGIRGNEVLMSEDGLPHAWPFEYRQPLDYDPVGLGSIEGALMVMTKGPLYMAQGTSPETMLLVETAVQQACVSEESIVSMASGVVYASPDGLVFIGGGAAPALVTGMVLTDREWQRINPATIRASHWNGVYFASFDGADGPGAFLFDPMTSEAGIIWLDLPRLSAIYNRVEFDRLYMVDDGGSQIVEWEGDDTSTFAPFRWRSRPYDMAAPAALGVARVRADAYPVTLRLFRDGAEQAEVSVPDAEPVRLPGARLGRSYSLEVEGAHRVYEAAVATTVSELRAG